MTVTSKIDKDTVKLLNKTPIVSAKMQVTKAPKATDKIPIRLLLIVYVSSLMFLNLLNASPRKIHDMIRGSTKTSVAISKDFLA
jgi:hypothetical protein